MARKKLPAVESLGRNLELFSSKEAKEKVLAGSEELAEISDPEKIALWLQGAMKRLDKAVDRKTRTRIMEECGHACAKANHATIDRVVAKRKKYASVEEFLEAEGDKALPGMRLERKGSTLYQYYMPTSFHYRCFCSLLRGLPPRDTVSETYCQCSKGFVQAMWKRIVGKPVNVEVLETAVSGAKECKFRIR
jgi:predicted hydrocarbon binding protein